MWQIKLHATSVSLQPRRFLVVQLTFSNSVVEFEGYSLSAELYKAARDIFLSMS